MTMFRPQRSNIRQFGGQDGRLWQPGMFSGQAGASNPATPLGTQNGTPAANTAYAPGNVVNAPPPRPTEKPSTNAQLESNTPTPRQPENPGFVRPPFRDIAPPPPPPPAGQDFSTEDAFVGQIRNRLSLGMALTSADIAQAQAMFPNNPALIQALVSAAAGGQFTYMRPPAAATTTPPPVMNPKDRNAPPGTYWNEARGMYVRDPSRVATEAAPAQQSSVYDRPEVLPLSAQMEAKIANGTITATDALIARQQGDEALAQRILAAVAGNPPAVQPRADVDYGQTPARRNSVRIGGVGRGGIYTG